MYSTCSVTTEYFLRFLSSSSCQNRFFWIDRHENSLRAKAKSHKEKCGNLYFFGSNDLSLQNRVGDTNYTVANPVSSNKMRNALNTKTSKHFCTNLHKGCFRAVAWL